MKWTNRGHELDKLAEKYLQVKNLYIWGMGKQGFECLNFLKWLRGAEDFKIFLMDSDPVIQGFSIDGNVIQLPQILLDGYDNSNSVVVVTPISNGDIIKHLNDNNIENYFTWVHKHSSKINFIQNFVCVWILYKHGKLMHHWGEFITTNKCNLNCIGCLNFTSYIRQYWEVPLAEFKKHIDVFFSKYDYVYSFHFCGGEPLLCKDLGLMIKYLLDNYKDRIWNYVFIITNGTILPGEDLLQTLKEYSITMYIDDYTDSLPSARENFNALTELLHNRGVRFLRLYTDKWIDVDIENADYSRLSEEELIAHRDNCNTFLQTFNNGTIYSCCYTEYARNSQAIQKSESDGLDINRASKTELLEYGLGYTESGYVGMCKHCNGVGKEAKFMPCAVQKTRGAEI
jgi:organic radical activating enzyme